MKVITDSSPVELGANASEPIQFKIKASKELFLTLSSGLYNNQIGAVVRELSCNAYDAHVAAGKAHIPFAIHMPTRLEPYFAVEDYGVGLSDEDILELYTTYGSSNRSDSNLFIGAMGLGSKSPFSYTEGFTIESRYNGKKTTYGCFISETGTPTVQKQMEVSCLDEDEPFFAQSMNNGMKITFPVKVVDIQEFNNNASKMLEFFNPPPKINESLTIRKIDYAMKTDKWGIRKTNRSGYHEIQGVRAIQGMVAYSVGTIDKSKLSWDEQQLLQQPLDLFFEIGDLSVAASRETLKNDERTVQNIIAAIKDVAHSYALEMKKQLAECKTIWDAHIFISKLINSYDNSMASLLKREYDKGTFDGEYTFGKFTKHMKGPMINELDHLDVTMSSFAQNSNYRSQSDAIKSIHFKDYQRRVEVLKNVKNKEATKEFYEVSVEANHRTLFVIGDIPFGAEKFVHHFIQRAVDNRIKQNDRINLVYLIARSRKEVSVDTVKFEALAIINKLGNPPFVYLSDLKARYWEQMKGEKEEAADRSIVAFDLDTTIYCYQDGYTKKGWRDGWSVEFDVDLTTGKLMIPKGEKKYYVKTKKLEPVAFQFENAEKFRQFVVAVNDAQLLPDFDKKKNKLYAMAENSEALKEAEKNKAEWAEFSQEVWKELLKLMTPELEMKLSLQVKSFKLDDIEDVFPKLSKELDPNSPMKQFVDSLSDARKINVRKAEALALIIQQASLLKVYEMKHATDFHEKWKEILKRYPLLSMMSYYRYNHNWKEKKEAIVEYITLIDQQRSFEDLIKQQQENSKLYLEAQNLDVQIEQEKTNDTTEESEEESIQEVLTGTTSTLHSETEVRPSNII